MPYDLFLTPDFLSQNSLNLYVNLFTTAHENTDQG